jgi:type IV secretory pathway VirB10-like protein
MERQLKLRSVFYILGIAVITSALIWFFSPSLVKVFPQLTATKQEASSASRGSLDVERRLNDMKETARQITAKEPNLVSTNPVAPISESQPIKTTKREITPQDRLALDAIAKKIAEEDERREARRVAGLQSPLGESLYSISDMNTKSESVIPNLENIGFKSPPPSKVSLKNSSEDGIIAAPNTETSDHLLATGSVIGASLINEIRSELPGIIKAQVSNDVYDTLTGRYIVIPRGSMLVGTYGEKTQNGQNRLFVSWNSMRFPDGTFVDLQNTGGVDAEGASGVKGKKSSGLLGIILGATLLNLSQGLSGQNQSTSDIESAARIAVGSAGGTVAERYLERKLSQGTRFKVKAGTIINVMLEEDYYFSGRPIY